MTDNDTWLTFFRFGARLKRPQAPRRIV
jgi:hypothetical protein